MLVLLPLKWLLSDQLPLAATDLKPYVGVQFAAIPEFPEVGSAVAQEMAAALSGAKSVKDALAASQAAAEAIMSEAGYFSGNPLNRERPGQFDLPFLPSTYHTFKHTFFKHYSFLGV